LGDLRGIPGLVVKFELDITPDSTNLGSRLNSDRFFTSIYY
jgi:hypothetical protein